METYNTSSKDIKEWAQDFDESARLIGNDSEAIQHLLWATEELAKIVFYQAKRIDDLQGVEHD